MTPGQRLLAWTVVGALALVAYLVWAEHEDRQISDCQARGGVSVQQRSGHRVCVQPR